MSDNEAGKLTYSEALFRCETGGEGRWIKSAIELCSPQAFWEDAASIAVSILSEIAHHKDHPEQEFARSMCMAVETFQAENSQKHIVGLAKLSLKRLRAGDH